MPKGTQKSKKSYSNRAISRKDGTHHAPESPCPNRFQERASDSGFLAEDSVCSG